MANFQQRRRLRVRKNNKLASAVGRLAGAGVVTGGLISAFTGEKSAMVSLGIVLTSMVGAQIVDNFVFNKLKKRTQVEPSILTMAAVSPEVRPLLSEMKRIIAERDALILRTAKGKNPDKNEYKKLTNKMILHAKRIESRVIKAARKSKMDGHIIKEYQNFFKYAKSGDVTFLDGSEI